MLDGGGDLGNGNGGAARERRRETIERRMCGTVEGLSLEAG